MGAKQHYVPQFLLKNWSIDKKNIGIYLIENDRFKVGPLRDQAQRHFLYGADQRVENLLGILENEVSHIIKRFLEEDISVELDEQLKIKTFVASQFCRTPAFVSYMNESLTGLVRNIMSKTTEAKRFEKLIASTIINYSNPVREQISMIVDILPSLFDLKVCIIKNTTAKRFIIGEHPVVVLNPLLAEKKWPARSGLGLKGAVIVMPLSPDYMLCLYDRKTYGIVGRGRIAKINDADVCLLNLCQFFNTKRCIYAVRLEEDFKSNSYESESYRQTVKANVDTFTLPKGENNQGRYLIRNTILDYPIEEHLSFLAYKDFFLPDCLSFADVIREDAEMNRRQYQNSTIYKKLHPHQDGSADSIPEKEGEE